MSTPNLDSRYAKPTDITTAIAAQATTDAGQYATQSALSSKQPVSQKGTYASRPTTGLIIGQEWFQTDTAGGNPAGTATRWNGSTWDVVGIGNPQIASLGMQSNTWITPLPAYGYAAPSATQVTAGAGGIFGMLFRPKKDMLVASLGAYTSLTSGNMCLSIYRVDGTTLTQIVTTGSVALSAGSTTMTRLDVTTTGYIYAGLSYYIIGTCDQSGGLYLYAWTNTNRWSTFIGGTVGEAPVIGATGSFMPLPASIDTTTITLTFPNAYAMLAASSLS